MKASGHPDKKREQTVIGLLGGIASGKSTVAEMMEACGADVVDADAIAHEALEQPDIQERISVEFGSEFVSDGTVHRSLLADAVFQSAERMKTLNGLIHPYVLERIEERMQRFREDEDRTVLVLDVPLLVEKGLHKRCDVLVYVEAPEDVRIKRVKENRGWSEEQLQRRQSFQEDLDLKRDLSDYTIRTDQKKELTRERVRTILSKLDNPPGAIGR